MMSSGHRISQMFLLLKKNFYIWNLFSKKIEKKIEGVEYSNRHNFIYNKFTLDKEKIPDIFAIFLYPTGENSQLICFECYKVTDEWYDVVISQDSDEYEDDPTIPGFSEYWKCDGFESLKILLDKWL